jgi:hypothetical protein
MHFNDDFKSGWRLDCECHLLFEYENKLIAARIGLSFNRTSYMISSEKNLMRWMYAITI